MLADESSDEDDDDDNDNDKEKRAVQFVDNQG